MTFVGQGKTAEEAQSDAHRQMIDATQGFCAMYDFSGIVLDVNGSPTADATDFTRSKIAQYVCDISAAGLRKLREEKNRDVEEKTPGEWWMSLK